MPMILPRFFRIHTANKDLSFEVCISCSKNNQNRKICNHEVVGKLSVQGSV